MSALGEPRAFARDRDLTEVVRIFADAHADPARPDYQHPGGMEWWLRRIAKDTFSVHVWERHARIAALVIDDDGYVIARSADRALSTLTELIAWAESRSRTLGRASLELAAADDERDLREALAARGYAPDGTESRELVFEVTGEPSAPALPPGYRLVTLQDLSDDAYIELHRAAWSTVRPSDYSQTLHDIVASMPDFRRDMVPVAIAPDGSPAAYCIGWFDEASRSVEIEPLGTHPAHRRRGLARAIVMDVHRRAWRRGARTVMVWGSHRNAAATQLYISSGMAPRRLVRGYRREL